MAVKSLPPNADQLYTLTSSELTSLLGAHNALFCALNKTVELDPDQKEEVIRASCAFLGQIAMSIFRRAEGKDSENPPGWLN